MKDDLKTYKCKLCGTAIPLPNGVYGVLRQCKCGSLKVDWNRLGYHRILGKPEEREIVNQNVTCLHRAGWGKKSQTLRTD